MIKYFLFFIFSSILFTSKYKENIVCSVNYHDANTCLVKNSKMQTDTLVIINYRFQSVLKNKRITFKWKGDAIYIQNRIRSTKDNGAIFDLINNNYFYFIIYDRFGRKIEEGRWRIEHFHGKYKSYYKNGRIRNEGRLDTGWECKLWIYYNRNGTIQKKVDYGKCPEDLG